MTETNDERVRKYAEALICADPERVEPLVITQHDAEMASAAMEVADSEQAELRTSRDAFIGHNRELIAERRTLLDKVARVEALHVRSYPTASDEAYGTNVECSCGDRWPCDTRAALDGDA